MSRYSKSRKLPERPLTMEVEAVNRMSDMIYERHDCALKAISIVTGVDYFTVHQVLEKLGRKYEGGTNDYEIDRALKELGFKQTALGPIHIRDKRRRIGPNIKPEWVQRIMDKYPAHHKYGGGLTTYHPHRFPEAWADLPPMLLHCREHVVAFKDGKIHDWSANRPLHINAAYRIEKIEED